MNFIDNNDDDDDEEEESISSKAPEPPIPEETQSLVPSDEIETSAPVEKKILLVTYTKLKLQSSEEEERTIIPMISSSESDTSTSDDDDEEDEPSESSTNYNILDDTLSLLDPSSPEVEVSQIRLFPSTTNKPSVSRTKYSRFILHADPFSYMISNYLYYYVDMRADRKIIDEALCATIHCSYDPRFSNKIHR